MLGNAERILIYALGNGSYHLGPRFLQRAKALELEDFLKNIQTK